MIRRYLDLFKRFSCFLLCFFFQLLVFAKIYKIFKFLSALLFYKNSKYINNFLLLLFVLKFNFNTLYIFQNELYKIICLSRYMIIKFQLKTSQNYLHLSTIHLYKKRLIIPATIFYQEKKSVARNFKLSSI